MILLGGGIAMVILTRARQNRITSYEQPAARSAAGVGGGETGRPQDAPGS
jgi:hypothetical protein